MKRFTSLKYAKKSIIIQVVCLSAGLLILCFALWLSGHRRFILDLPLEETAEDLTYADVVIQWEGEEIPVESFETRYVTTPQDGLNTISISMLPEKAGQYKLIVNNTYGQLLAMDLIDVSRFGLAYSWTTGSFTGSEYILLFVVLFQTGIFCYHAVWFPETERASGKL